MLGGGGEKQAAPERIPDAPPWPEAERLAFEKESLGFFISGPPARALPRGDRAVGERDHRHARPDAAAAAR